MGGKSSKMGYERLVNNNVNKPLFGTNAEFNPNFPQPAAKSVNNLTRNRRFETLRKQNNRAYWNSLKTNEITKTVMNSASKIPGIAFGTRRQTITLKGGKRKTRRLPGGKGRQ